MRRFLTSRCWAVVGSPPVRNRHTACAASVGHEFGGLTRDSLGQVATATECANVHHTLAVHDLEVLPDDASGDARLEDDLVLHEDGAPGCRHSRALSIAGRLRWWRYSAEADTTIIAAHCPRPADGLSVVESASLGDTSSSSGSVER